MSKKTYQAIHIDAENKEIRLVTINREASLTQLQWFVSGLITPGHYFENEDLLYVDEEALMKSPEHFFIIEGAHQPFAGNGVVVAGKEYEDVVSTLESIKNKVKFFNRNEINAHLWLKDWEGL